MMSSTVGCLKSLKISDFILIMFCSLNETKLEQLRQSSSLPKMALANLFSYLATKSKIALKKFSKDVSSVGN